MLPPRGIDLPRADRQSLGSAPARAARLTPRAPLYSAVLCASRASVWSLPSPPAGAAPADGAGRTSPSAYPVRPAGSERFCSSPSFTRRASSPFSVFRSTPDTAASSALVAPGRSVTARSTASRLAPRGARLRGFALPAVRARGLADARGSGGGGTGAVRARSPSACSAASNRRCSSTSGHSSLRRVLISIRMRSNRSATRSSARSRQTLHPRRRLLAVDEDAATLRRDRARAMACRCRPWCRDAQTAANVDKRKPVPESPRQLGAPASPRRARRTSSYCPQPRPQRETGTLAQTPQACRMWLRGAD